MRCIKLTPLEAGAVLDVLDLLKGDEPTLEGEREEAVEIMEEAIANATEDLYHGHSCNIPP